MHVTFSLQVGGQLNPPQHRNKYIFRAEEKGAGAKTEPTPVAPTQEELASLGQPFFEVKDPVEAARVNDFRLKYRSFRKGNAKGSKGEMKVLSRRCAAVEHSPKAHVPCAMASAGHGVRTKNAAVLDEAVGHSR